MTFSLTYFHSAENHTLIKSLEQGFTVTKSSRKTGFNPDGFSDTQIRSQKYLFNKSPLELEGWCNVITFGTDNFIGGGIKGTWEEGSTIDSSI